jgi:hypothetical protein
MKVYSGDPERAEMHVIPACTGRAPTDDRPAGTLTLPTQQAVTLVGS